MACSSFIHYKEVTPGTLNHCSPSPSPRLRGPKLLPGSSTTAPTPTKCASHSSFCYRARGARFPSMPWPWEAMASCAVPDSPTLIDCCIFSADVFSPHPHGLKPTRSPPLNRPERVGSDPSQLGGQGWPGPAVPWPQKNIYFCLPVDKLPAALPLSQASPPGPAARPVRIRRVGRGGKGPIGC